MITNEKQYRITKTQATKFLDALNNFRTTDNTTIVEKAKYGALKSQYEELKEQIEEYELLKSGKVQVSEAHSLDELPKILIQSRIVQGLTQSDLAQKLNLKTQQIQRYEADMYAQISFTRLNEIAMVLGVSLINDAEFILKASDEGFWLNFPIKEMWKKGWFEDFSGTLDKAKRNAEELITNFLSNTGIKRFSNALHKKNLRSNSKLNQFSILAWQAYIIQKSFFTKVEGKFNVDDMNDRWLKDLVKLSVYDDGPVKAIEYLSKSGIRVIIEPRLEHTYLDGAAMKGADNEPIVALTLRQNRLDNFWFVLMHELGHIKRHLYIKGSKEEFIIDEEIEDKKIDNKKEDEADKYAQEGLIPSDKWNKSPVKFFPNSDMIKKQAEVWGISPAIVAGRIRRETGNYTILNELIGNGKVRQLFPNIIF